MATKKEKRARGLAKRQAFLEEERKRGLIALNADRQRRAAELRKEWQPRHDEKHHKFVDECPICRDIKKHQKKEATNKAVAKVAKSLARS